MGAGERRLQGRRLRRRRLDRRPRGGPHRRVGVGKNTNLLLPGAGSWFVLGSVITTAELPKRPAPWRTAAARAAAAWTPARPGRSWRGMVDANRCLAWVLQRSGAIPVELRPDKQYEKCNE